MIGEAIWTICKHCHIHGSRIVHVRDLLKHCLIVFKEKSKLLTIRRNDREEIHSWGSLVHLNYQAIQPASDSAAEDWVAQARGRKFW